MIHTYRDTHVVQQKADRSFLVYLGFVLLIWFVPMLSGAPFTRGDAFILGATVIVIVALVGAYRRVQERSCVEIRLSDDGTCELETPRRVTRLHVQEIRSVRYSAPSDDSSEHYTIDYRGGKVRVGSEMTDVGDFLARLQSLNPLVDLSGVPTETGVSESGGKPEKKPAFASRFLRSAFFPLLVVALLLYLASEALTSK